MSCTKFEGDIALLAGGDLPAGRVARVEQHLAGCQACRALIGELRAGNALLAEWRDDPLDDAMVARLRRGVLARIETPQPPRWQWRLAVAGTLMMVALVLAMVMAWPLHQPATPAPMARVTPPRAIQASPAKIAPVRHRLVRRHRRVPDVRPVGEPLIVQFVTSDPNIVIYWLVDQKPQGD